MLLANCADLWSSLLVLEHTHVWEDMMFNLIVQPSLQKVYQVWYEGARSSKIRSCVEVNRAYNSSQQELVRLWCHSGVKSIDIVSGMVASDNNERVDISH